MVAIFIDAKAALILIRDRKLYGHQVRPQLGFRRTWANFGWPMTDDRLLFAALRFLPLSAHDFHLHAVSRLSRANPVRTNFVCTWYPCDWNGSFTTLYFATDQNNPVVVLISCRPALNNLTLYSTESFAIHNLLNHAIPKLSVLWNSLVFSPAAKAWLLSCY